MYYIFDDELDNFITFDKNNELEYLYYIINIYYNKYEFNSIQFNEELKLSKKRKLNLKNKINKKYKN